MKETLTCKRHTLLAALLLAVLVFLCLPAAADAGAEEDETSEWTVLVYLCGSDLESRYGYAAENLAELINSTMPFDMYNLYFFEDMPEDWDPKYTDYNVSVLVQTGGSRDWHAEALGMDIRSDRLQRWRFRAVTENPETHMYENSFELADEQPLRSMADTETLADFIRWGTALCPAEKYALVLWDHGEGSMGGLFIDELFPEDRMYLDELGQALRDSGTFFEAVVFDACLMANVETAEAIRDSARWMVASEENVAGRGTAIGDWIRQLYYYPEADGEWLGRWVCELTQIKYIDDYDEQIRSLMTWSVTDLSEMAAVTEALERYFATMNDLYVRMPELLCSYLRDVQILEAYGDAGVMRDVAGLLYDPDYNDMMPDDLRRDMLHSLMRAVKYVTHGTGRTHARGLSLCFALGLEPEELDIYARNCPFPHFLALLDAINANWEAPEAVYEKAGRLPPLNMSGEYGLTLEKKRDSAGLPALRMHTETNSVAGIYYSLYRLNGDTDQIVLLGTARTQMDVVNNSMIVYTAADLMNHPVVEGVCCDFEIIDYDENKENFLARVPVQIGQTEWDLRVGFDSNTGYTVYGLWEGYDDNNGVFSRNVKSLAQFAGQEFRLLYPVDDAAEGAGLHYEFSEPMTVLRQLYIDRKPLEPGTYFLEYWIDDIFGHSLTLDKIRLTWDGERITLPEDFVWEGTIGGE